MQETQEMQLPSLGWEESMENEMATHSGILTWKIPCTEKPGRLQSKGLQESDMTYQLNHHHSPPNSPLCYIYEADGCNCGPTLQCSGISPRDMRNQVIFLVSVSGRNGIPQPSIPSQCPSSPSVASQRVSF